MKKYNIYKKLVYFQGSFILNTENVDEKSYVKLIYYSDKIVRQRASANQNTFLKWLIIEKRKFCSQPLAFDSLFFRDIENNQS